jgi:hypothetical protein
LGKAAAGGNLLAAEEAVRRPIRHDRHRRPSPSCWQARPFPVSAAWSSKLGISEAQAKHAILGDGYTRVQNLHKAAHGWAATALEGGKPVTVLVDERGDVAKAK